MLMLLRHSGVEQVAVVGGIPARLALAKALGAWQTILASTGADPASELKETLGREFTTVVEASGSPSAMKTALHMAQRGGRILVLGDYEEARADFEWNFLLHRELELVGSNAGAGAWPAAVRLAVEGSLPLERLVTHRFPFFRFNEAVALVRSREAGVIKAVLLWDQETY
jgi:threonine dehydrogenase-like Zn-dependent dehydrogenase